MCAAQQVQEYSAEVECGDERIHLEGNWELVELQRDWLQLSKIRGWLEGGRRQRHFSCTGVEPGCHADTQGLLQEH